MDKTTWLAGTIEEPIDALEEIVDPHHHLWDFPTGTYLLPELHEENYEMQLNYMSIHNAKANNNVVFSLKRKKTKRKKS